MSRWQLNKRCDRKASASSFSRLILILFCSAIASMYLFYSIWSDLQPSLEIAATSEKPSLPQAVEADSSLAFDHFRNDGSREPYSPESSWYLRSIIQGEREYATQPLYAESSIENLEPFVKRAPSPSQTSWDNELTLSQTAERVPGIVVSTPSRVGIEPRSADSLSGTQGPTVNSSSNPYQNPTGTYDDQSAPFTSKSSYDQSFFRSSNVRLVNYDAPSQQIATPQTSTSPPSASTPPSPSQTAGSPNSATAPPKESNRKGNYLDELGAALTRKVTPILNGGLYGQVEYQLLRTETAGSGSLLFRDLVSNDSRSAEMESDFGLGTRWTLGMRHQIVGFRVRYSDFREESFQHEGSRIEELWPRLEISQRLDLKALDVELTQQYHLMGATLDSSFGVRHSRLEANSSVFGLGSLGDRLEVHGLAHVFRSLEAIGPTFTIGGHQSLPWKLWCAAPCDSISNASFCDPCRYGWSWFWNARGSILWGDVVAKATTESQTYIKANESMFAVSRSSDGAYVNTNSEAKLFHNEILIGLEYCRPLIVVPSTMRFRTAIEYQRWDTGKAVAKSQSHAFLASSEPRFGGRVESSAAAENRYFDLIGLNFSMTLNY